MSRMTEQQLYIYGGYTSAISGRTFETINSANGSALAAVQAAGHEGVDRAVKSALQRQKTWALVTAMEHSCILRRAADILRGRNDELAKLETLDIKKVYSETSTVDIVTGADVLEYCAGLIPALKGNQISLREMSFVYTHRKPLGAMAEVGIWNYLIRIALWKSTPTLAADNVMIFKPSEAIPLIALKLVEIYSEAGPSDGVSSMSPGVGAEAEQYLAEHPGTAKVSFTGGVASGKKVMANSTTSSLREVTMELGDKSPLIVFDDADPGFTVDIAMVASFFSSNQVCASGTRVFVPAKCRAVSEQKILARVERARAGDAFDPQTNFGPLVSFPHCDNVLRYIIKSKGEGVRVLCDGGVLRSDGFDNGVRVLLTVFADCSDDMTIVHEEILGPVMSILTYGSEDEVIHRASDIDYGLAVGIMVAGLNRVHRVVHQLEAGICWINAWDESPAEMPVGDYKHSGAGRENGVATPQNYIRVESTQIEMTKF